MSPPCRLGGPAPCIDDMCHGCSTTLCGLEWGFDLDDGSYDPDDSYDEVPVWGIPQPEEPQT